MNVDIHESWKTQLQTELDTPYFKELTQFVTAEYKQQQCFPPENEIFNAFNSCSLNQLKVVIIGQDPYHNYNQANGLCFSVVDGVKHPPSLINIFKEIETDLGKLYPSSGNLEHWAKQGVFLLNATLTVRAHEPGSHQKRGWETFTDAVIKTISDQKENVVFLLWGGFAKKKAKLIDANKHHILLSGHPSPLSANRGYWFGNKHFSQTNKLLKEFGLVGIDW
ncbi:uracil-DNA glycosylase [Olleya sp. R77988]|uniref:uracil-DNA glycosylase n=1 Tax=Olleya sp. R77988 TaxID=3093875 RepID=UPI0037C98A65